jgi:hypothetical protein
MKKINRSELEGVIADLIFVLESDEETVAEVFNCDTAAEAVEYILQNNFAVTCKQVL